MNEKYAKVKNGIKFFNENAGVITLIITFFISASIFLSDLFLERFELGYSAFFGFKKILRIEYDFIKIFFTFLIILLIFASAFLALNPKSRKEKSINRKILFCTQIVFTVLITSVFYLFVLSQVALSNEEIFRCIYSPAIPLLLMIFLVFYSENKICSPRHSYCILGITIFLTFVTMIIVSWAIFNNVDWFESVWFTVKIILVSGYFTVAGWIIDRTSKRKITHDEAQSDSSIKKAIKWTPIYVVLTMILIIIIPISILLILITSSGWSSAERTREVYMTCYDEKNYILFEQDDCFIALPIVNSTENAIDDIVRMKSIENEYRYLNKESILVKLVKINKIERSESDDSIIIEFSEKIPDDQ